MNFSFDEILAIVKEIKKSNYAEYMRVVHGVDMSSVMDYETALNTFHSLVNVCGQEVVEKAFKRAHADSNINTRLRSRIEFMLNMGDCVFLTFTFTDDSLNRYDTEYLRLCVRRYLNLYTTLYVANVDYGKENGRIHFHAIGLASRVNLKAWTFGALNVQKVRKGSNPLQLARYVSKLANHALKDTTRRERLIYSRDFEKIMKKFQKPIDNDNI